MVVVIVVVTAMVVVTVVAIDVVVLATLVDVVVEMPARFPATCGAAEHGLRSLFSPLKHEPAGCSCCRRLRGESQDVAAPRRCE